MCEDIYENLLKLRKEIKNRKISENIWGFGGKLGGDYQIGDSKSFADKYKAKIK